MIPPRDRQARPRGARVWRAKFWKNIGPLGRVGVVTGETQEPGNQNKSAAGSSRCHRVSIHERESLGSDLRPHVKVIGLTSRRD
jgi:hypothetical protein